MKASSFAAPPARYDSRLTEGVLDESFFVLYGDSFLPVDFAPIWTAFQSCHAAALMTVLRNEGRWDSSNVVYSNGRVTLYDKRSSIPRCSTSITAFPLSGEL